jgi:hypothetical protein
VGRVGFEVFDMGDAAVSETDEVADNEGRAAVSSSATVS